MRVHELAESLGVNKADLSEFLEGLGEKSHHLSHVSPEVELLARDYFATDDEDDRPIPATDEDQAEFHETMEWLQTIEESEGPTTAEPHADEQTTWEAFAANPEAMDRAVEYYTSFELDMSPEAEAAREAESRAKRPEMWVDTPASLDGEVREVDPPGIDPDLPAATCDYEAVGLGNTIPLLADNGAYRGTLCLDPTAAERLKALLKGRSVADATLHPERGELVAVTWPDYQKLVVRLDE